MGEDRGTPVYIWDGHWSSSFTPFTEFTTKVRISVPIGYKLVSHSYYGVVLQNVYKRHIDARYALTLAMNGKDGFRIP